MGTKERRQRESEKLKEKILHTAGDLLSEHGYEKLTIRMIAEAIEYSPRTIYLHFADKDDLLRDIVEMAFSDTLRHLPPPDVIEKIPPFDLLGLVVRNHLALALSDPELYRTILHLLQEKGYPPGPNQTAVMEFAARHLENCLGGTEADPGVIRAALFTFVAMLRGLALSMVAKGTVLTDTERERIIVTFLQVMKRGLPIPAAGPQAWAME